MEGCCVCLDECATLIINSGTSICSACAHKLDSDRCPSTRMEITTKLPNNFAKVFYQYPQPPLPFDMEEFINSSDKIAYMNQFDKIEIVDPDTLIKNNKCVLNLDEFKIFTKKCINLDCPGIYGRRLMHLICRTNNLDMIKCLVENGADVNCTDNLMERPIHFACDRGDKALELVKFLVANGADVNCVDKWGKHPLHFARKDKALELVKFLKAQQFDRKK